MTPGRVLVLGALAVAAAAIVAAARALRRRGGRGPEQIAIGDVGLELLDGCCAFVVFTSAACRPCRGALRVVESAARSAPAPAAVTTLDAVERSDLALRYGVRTVPTTFLVTASGRVVGRWGGVPDPADVRAALDRVT